MEISIRCFEREDIPKKVEWINNIENNRYLHYDIPLRVDKTEMWFDKNVGRTDRYDAVILADGKAVGLIGLLSIDNSNHKAEYYVMIGERAYLRKGIAAKASKLLLNYAFNELALNRVYLYTESGNISAMKSYERIGFKREGLIKKDIFSKGRYVDRYIYGITKNDFYGYCNTPIFKLDVIGNNDFYVKREDFIPFSFGGNKARKAKLYFEEIDYGLYDCVVTYGSMSSNHCRVVVNLATSRGLKCYIISPENESKETYNSRLMKNYGAEIIFCNLNEVHDTIEKKLEQLREKGNKPFFIAGGGHGNIGTQAYVDCYEEICKYEKENNIFFDYIFHATGTGTTQAGLICGQLINRDKRKIVGISIARKNPYGRNVVLDSVKEYLNKYKIFVDESEIDNNTIFVDNFVNGGYGVFSNEIKAVIEKVMKYNGLPLDMTYTGKAFAGMLEYVKYEKMENKKILFIHTGGTPLFFDDLNRI